MRDLQAIRVSPPPFSPPNHGKKTHSADENDRHPGEDCLRCWHCNELGHTRQQCLLYRAESEKRREEWEERRRVREEQQKAFEARQRARQEREAVWKEKDERWERSQREKMIRSGEVAVGDGGRTIAVWSRT